ncbi:hypothetical protein [Vallitalea okinawensis]|uniref:hypothetical protein n=1 Tax=Vallitalea okinawensis TaxID=2078660 RepID=UPI000CFCA3C4|nr:hypothetical protein [Vallitalea okinawensis]
MKKIKILSIVVVLSLSLFGCSEDTDIKEEYNKKISDLEDKNKELMDRNREIEEANETLLKNIDLLEDNIENLQLEIEETAYSQFRGGLLYVGYEDNELLRVVDHQGSIKALPVEYAEDINVIEANTLIQVLDKVEVHTDSELGNEWYYVAIPVYDTPMDYKGWIRVSETIPYSKENQKQITNVSITNGEKIVESYEFPNFEGEVNYEIADNISGKIEEFRNGYVRLSCVGGRAIWVKEDSLIYPELP